MSQRSHLNSSKIHRKLLGYQHTAVILFTFPSIKDDFEKIGERE
jgi:hypothetical protein